MNIEIDRIVYLLDQSRKSFKNHVEGKTESLHQKAASAK